MVGAAKPETGSATRCGAAVSALPIPYRVPIREHGVAMSLQKAPRCSEEPHAPSPAAGELLGVGNWGQMGDTCFLPGSAERFCYEKLNVEGTERGNCGREGSGWMQCNKQ